MNILSRLTLFIVGLLLGMFLGFITTIYLTNNFNINLLTGQEGVFTEKDTVIDLRFTRQQEALAERRSFVPYDKENATLFGSGQDSYAVDIFIDKKLISLVKLDKEHQKDSLLHQISNVDMGILESSILVEYWRSPLNFKGYELNGNRLKLYGIDVNKPLELQYQKKVLYLKFEDRPTPFILEPTSKPTKFYTASEDKESNPK